jgi:uncharacterized protein (TIGR02118 family)
MIRVVALHNPPVELSSYDDYYVNVHMPLVRRVPGVRNIRYGKVLRGADGGLPPYFLISDVYFDDEAALERALKSHEMAAAFADVPNFATGGVSIMICEAEDVPPEPADG